MAGTIAPASAPFDKDDGVTRVQVVGADADGELSIDSGVPVQDVTAAFEEALAESVVTIGTGSTTVVNANPDRSLLLIQNTEASGGDVIWVRLSASAATVSITFRLDPGGSLCLPFAGAVTAIAAPTSAGLAVAEL